jgi:guanylate kinase
VNGRIVIFSGPSGVGKDTLLNAWTVANPRVRRVVAYTTRSPRTGEINGVDYNFVDVQTFLEKAENGDFLEFKEVHGNHYATPLKDMEAMLADGLIAVLKIDVQGAMTAMDLRPDAISIFILPPTWEELERRIRSRALDTEDQIATRLLNAREELEMAGKYRYCVVNEDIPQAIAELETIIA